MYTMFVLMGDKINFQYLLLLLLKVIKSTGRITIDFHYQIKLMNICLLMSSGILNNTFIFNLST